MRALKKTSSVVPQEVAGGRLLPGLGEGSQGSVAFLNPWQEVPSWVPERQFPMPEWDHAAPLTPIRDRDLQEMKAMFEREDMGVLEGEVERMLGLLMPEPLWEEEGWATLGDFGVISLG